MIVKREDGYYVVSEKGEKKLRRTIFYTSGSGKEA
jgi:hypothetical protein